MHGFRDERERMAGHRAAQKTTRRVAGMGRQRAAVDVGGLGVLAGVTVSVHNRDRVRVDFQVVHQHVLHGHDSGRRGQEDRRRALAGPDPRHLEAAGGVQAGADAEHHAVAGAVRRRRVGVRRLEVAGRVIPARLGRGVFRRSTRERDQPPSSPSLGDKALGHGAGPGRAYVDPAGFAVLPSQSRVKRDALRMI